MAIGARLDNRYFLTVIYKYSRFTFATPLKDINAQTTVTSLKPIVDPAALVTGGTINSNGFFVQSILADRYIHRREK